MTGVCYLETDRLTLVPPYSDGDRDLLAFLLSDPESMKYIAEPITGEAFVRVYEWLLCHWRHHGFGPGVLKCRSSGIIIGVAGLKKIELEGKTIIDLGFSVLKQHQGKGYAFEAASAIIEQGRERHGFKKIFANTQRENEASERLLEKLGFHYVREIERENAGIQLGRSRLWEKTV